VCASDSPNHTTCFIPDSEINGILAETMIQQGAELVILTMLGIGISALTSGCPPLMLIIDVALVVAMFIESEEWADIRDTLDVRGDVTLEITRDPVSGVVVIDNGVDRPAVLNPSFANTFVYTTFEYGATSP
jgi:hypothetical protein